MSAKRFLTGLIALIMAFCLLPAGAARADGPENDGNSVAAVAVEENVQATFADREQGPMINVTQTQATAGPAEAEATEQSSVQIWTARGLGVLMAIAVQRRRNSVYRKRK